VCVYVCVRALRHFQVAEARAESDALRRLVKLKTRELKNTRRLAQEVNSGAFIHCSSRPKLCALLVTIATMGGDLQPGCLADQLLTGLGQP